jgi:hypothetical protein
MNIIDRRKDILKHPTIKPSTRKLSDIEGLAIHHSLTLDGSADAFANYHVNTNGWSCMGYTYVIRKNGLIEWCADWTVKTPHIGNGNKKYLGINVVGDFRTQKPTPEQLKSLYELVEYLMKELNIPVEKVIGHQELPDGSYLWKQCPAFNMDQLRGHIQYKTYGEVDCNYQNDLKIGVTKPVELNLQQKPEKVVETPPVTIEGGRILKLSNVQFTALANAYKNAYDKGILSSDQWFKKAEAKTLTVDEATYLNAVIMSRLLK